MKKGQEFKANIDKEINKKGFCQVWAYNVMLRDKRHLKYSIDVSKEKNRTGYWYDVDAYKKYSRKKATEKLFVHALDELMGASGKYDYACYTVKNANDKTLKCIIYISNKGQCNFIEVKSVHDYLKKTIEKSKETKRQGYNLYYRGQLPAWGLEPSLYREKQWVKNEASLNAQIICDRPQDFKDCQTTFEKLVKLKHFNQPSRLLDITSNPIVGLFFACECMKAHKGENGIVVEAFSKRGDEKIAGISDTVTLLSALTNSRIILDDCGSCECGAKQCYQKGKDNKQILPACNDKDSRCYKCKTEPIQKRGCSECNCNRNLKEIAHQAKKESIANLEWDDLCYGEMNQCIVVKPPLNNERIRQQQGEFIMSGLNPSNFFQPPSSFYNFFKLPSELKNIGYSYYLILPESLDRIVTELEILGIDEYYIYADFEKDIDVRKRRVLDE